MLPLVLFGALGTSGIFYMLLNYFWPGWYLDYKYRRIANLWANIVAKQAARGRLLIDVFEDVAAKSPDKTCVIFEDRKYSYGFFERKGNQLARAIVEIGVRSGTTVAVLVYNEPAYIWTFLGLQKAGCPAALINFNLRSRSLAHCINVSGAKVLLVGEGEDLVSAVRDVAGDIPGVAVYLQGSTSQPKPPGFLSLELVMSRVPGTPPGRELRKDVNVMSTFAYLYTSGTTGLPKASITTQAKAIGASFAMDVFGMTGDDVTYNAMPLYHASALMIGLGNTLTHGATMVLKRKFSASQFLEDCRKHDVTTILYIGEMCRYLVARPKDKMDAVHKIRIAIGNGLRKDVWAELENRFKIPKIFEFYGASEGMVGFFNVTGKQGACGRSSPYMRKFAPCEFVKFDHESQAPLRNKQGRCVPIGPNEVGLLIAPVVPGVMEFAGYRDNPEATRRKLLHDVFKEGDTYFNTGDLMRLDSQYYVYFNDRVGDTFRWKGKHVSTTEVSNIIADLACIHDNFPLCSQMEGWKGENVSTTEISNIIADLDFIQDANVYGVTVPGAEGRAGMAAITMNEEGATLTTAMLTALSDHVTKVLPSYAQPRFIRVQASFDMTSTFKHQKISLVQDGFDVNKISEPVFYLDPSLHSYLPLDKQVYSQIMARKVLL